MRFFVTTAVCIFACVSMAAGETAPGVVVERVMPDGAAAEAGFVAGDVLMRWSRAGHLPANPESASGSFSSPFDVREIEIEQEPRGGVTVSGLRGNQPLRAVLQSGRWGMVVRPILDPATEGEFLEAMAAIDSGDLDSGVAILERLSTEASRRGDQVIATWWLTRAASSLKAPELAADRDRLLAAALGAARATADPVIEARVHFLIGEAFKAQGRLVEAEQAHRRALALRERLAPDGLAVATSLNHLGSVVWRQGDLERAQELWEGCLTLRRRLAPGGIDEASSLNNLGILAYDRGDLASADELWSRSLEIFERLDPDSKRVALSLSNLVLIADARGDLATAEARARRSVAINERVNPGGVGLANSLSNLGIVARTRGDFASAEEAWRRAAGIFEALAPTSLEQGATLHNLAVVAFEYGDLATAEDLQRQALAIRESNAPVSLDTALSLEFLGIVATERGDTETAERLARRALEMRRKIAPITLEVAVSLGQLGWMALEEGNFDDAEEFGLEGLEIRASLAPESPAFAQSDQLLGEIAYRRGDLEGAEARFRHALKIREALMPGTSNESETLHALGKVLRDSGRTEPAIEMLFRAVAAIETQRQHRGGVLEGRGLVRDRELAVYRDLLQLLLDSGRPEDAFWILERSRAQGFLSTLAERDLVFTADIPEELDSERRMTAAAADRVLAELGGLTAFATSPGDAGQRGVGGLVPTDAPDVGDELLAELRRLRRRQEEIRSRIRAASPRLAALTEPEPLDLEETRAMLDPGTVLISYAVGQQSCHLFVVEKDGDGIDVVTLGIDPDELRSSVQDFRRNIQDPSGDVEELNRLARRLGGLLLSPAAPAISRARRVVIIPDGPLHLAPFAALRLAAGGDEQYLLEHKPLSIVVSATVLGELKATRRTGRPARVVAFADPSYPEQPVGAALRSGVTLSPLPATRREVEHLGHLFGPTTVTWLGIDATEERAKAVGPRATILHLAAHGLVSERLPLESAIVLSRPGPTTGAHENGYLQAWEVFEQVRLDADLVTLSACQTALGKEVTGEGIVGLTRAFQYAGARTVLASLWSVADDSTAELMDRFYRRLRMGTTTNEALRAAQLDLLRAPLVMQDGTGESRELNAGHPFHWAAFQLIGDWR